MRSLCWWAWLGWVRSFHRTEKWRLWLESYKGNFNSLGDPVFNVDQLFFLQEIFQKEPGNVVVSPFSTKLILLLLAEAAGEGTKTREQLNTILPNIRVPYSGRELVKTVLNSIQQSKGVTMQTGTRVYMDNSLKPRPRYADIVKRYYETQIENVNFNEAAEVAQRINNWVDNVTHSNIQNLVSEGEWENSERTGHLLIIISTLSDDVQNSIALFLNAVYFKGAWRRPFAPEKVVRNTFTTPNGQVQAQYLSDIDQYYFFESKELDSKILRLPYNNSKFSMFVVLPNANNNIDNLIKKLDSKAINRESWYLDEVEVDLKLPKFQFKSNNDLKSHLEAVSWTKI